MDQHEESNKLLENEFWCTTVSSSHKVTEILMCKYDFLEPPFLNIFLKALETVESVNMTFFINGEASFRMSYPFFLLSFEENFKDIDHTASVKDRTMFRE